MPRKGSYTALAFQLLSSKTEQDFVNKKRFDLGVQVVSGYQFNQFIAVGGGIGLDDYDETLMPIFGELRGYLVNSKNLNLSKAETLSSRRFPMSYSVQIGYNFPVENWVSKQEGAKIKGGLLVYPSIGMLFPTRNGAILQIDLGYKVQRFQREQQDWWGNFVVDKNTMKSLALRMGVSF
ncbi:MAG: hypothetical protein IPM82_07250 [Saprospiraceae bacterium]|nr:hypothetical protein [Saprospiraceae bacterium]